MKIYFAASIRGGRQDVELYVELIKYLSKYGEVLTEHIGDKNIEETGEKHMTDVEIHNRDMEWLMSSDIIVAEVTTPSLGVGYEIARAFEAEKRVICLYRVEGEKRLSAMLTGNKGLETYNYKRIEEAKRIIDKVLKLQHDRT